CVQNTKDYNF
nr:immunoglobulin light chain junction region [Macaca mulatta]